jgi:putative FmdB family regulatory protein
LSEPAGEVRTTMPIYEYRCPECGTEFEKLVQSQTVVACPSCESPKVSRRLSLFGTRSEGRLAGSSTRTGGGCCGGGCGCR